MLFAFLGPFAHLDFDDAWIDSVAAWFQAFFGDFFDQIVEPAFDAGVATGAFRQAAAEDLQRVHERQFPRRDAGEVRRFAHQFADDVVSQEQAVDFLDHAGGRFAAEHAFLAQVRLQFVDRQFDRPAGKPLKRQAVSAGWGGLGLVCRRC